MTVTTLRPTSDVETGWTDTTSGGGSGTSTLYVNVFDGTYVAWTEIGDSPYLHDGTSHRVETTSKGDDEGFFTFEDSGKTIELIDDVIIYVYVKSDGNDGVDVWVHDGAAEHKITPSGGVSGDTVDYGEEPLDYCYTHSQQLELCLDTWTKIDAAKIRLEKTTSGMAALVGVSSAILSVDWSGSIIHYTEVDEVTHDGDATMINTADDASADEDDLYGYPTFTLPAGDVISSVKVFFTARGLDAPYYGTIKGLLQISGTKYVGLGNTVTNSYVLYSKEWLLNPDTGLAWTEGDINGMDAGVRGRTLRRCVSKCTLDFYYYVFCTQVYIEVTHASAVAGGILAQIM